jgi:YD repeat-containing protein
MARIGYRILFTSILMSALALGVRAQTVTYRLHKEASTTTGLFQLKAANPDGTSLAIQSANLKGVAAGEYLVKAFDTQAGVPGAAGTIPAGSTISFSLWMRKTTTGGTLLPRAKLRLNNATGALFGAATGATALTSTLAKYTFTTTTTANVTLTAADRFYVWVGVNLTAAPTTNTTAELDVEGTTGGNYDSLVTVPLPVRPQINSLSPAMGPAGTTVTIGGTNFGATQGASAVTFNGVAASPTSWSADTIIVPVPSGATTGAVTVTVDGSTSNSQNFAVGEVGGLTGIVSRAVDGAPIVGAQVKAIQSGVVKGIATSGADGVYTLTHLLAGSYDVQALAGGHEFQTQTGQQVTANTSNTLNFALASAQVTYIYDEVARLVGVVDPSSETAKYTYDAAGNLTSISRQGSSQISIVEFSPNGGAFGVPVTIYGTGFSSDPGQNVVKFNGVAATVASSTTTQIVTSVPAGATTGTISVNSPAGAATSSAPFTIGGSTAPTITGFTPGVGAAGTSVTITGANFQTTVLNNKVAFNNVVAGVNTATATSLVTTVPTRPASGRLTVATPDGTAVSASDFYITPWPYTGTDVEFTGRIAFGETKTVTLNTSSKVAMLLFDGTTGQRISLHMPSTTMLASQIVTIVNPDGSELFDNVWPNGNFIDTLTLPYAGTYTIVIDPTGSQTGSLNLTLYDVPPDVTGTAVPGGPAVSVTTTTPGQNAKVSFSGTVGQRVSLGLSETMGWALVSIVKPDGLNLITSSRINNGLFDVRVLPATGAYTVVVDPETVGAGSLTLQLYNSPANTNAPLTFSGNADQRISLLAGGATGRSLVSVLNPDGSSLIAPTWTSGGGFHDPRVLAAAGTHNVVVDTENDSTGAMTLQLYDVLPDPVSTIVPGGPAVSLTTTTPGQNARVTFNGIAGRRISLSPSAPEGSRLSIVNPDGSYFISPSAIGFVDVRALPADGAYTIVIDPTGGATGNISLTLYDVPPDATATIVPGGPAVSATTTTPGQNMRVSFSGTAGQRVSLHVGGNIEGERTSILKPDGSYLVSPTRAWYIDAVTLPADGVYTILVDAEWIHTGTVTLTLNDVPPDALATIVPGGPAVTVTTATPGQNAKLTFDGIAGRKISINVSGTVARTRISILKPDGSIYMSPFQIDGGAGFISARVLPVTGAYTIVVDPDSENTGTTTLTLNDVP